MLNSNLEHEPLSFAAMLDDYVTLTEAAPRCLEKILPTAAISSDVGTADGLSAISKLKDRLQKQYEAAYPELTDVISHVIDQAEANARNLSSLFPHLILPGLVEIQMGWVGLDLLSKQPAFRSASFRFIEQSPPPVFAQLL